jgi:hypothetical protein
MLVLLGEMPRAICPFEYCLLNTAKPWEYCCRRRISDIANKLVCLRCRSSDRILLCWFHLKTDMEKRLRALIKPGVVTRQDIDDKIVVSCDPSA